VKDNSKKTSDGFKDLLKEKCPWHLDGNHTTEQCYQLRRALKDTPEPRHPHDKKGKKKGDEGNGDFQEPDKTVNVLFGGLPNRRAQKATRREVLSIEPAIPTPLRWSEVPITFSHADQWTSFSEPGRFPVVLKPVVTGSRLNKVLIDGGSGLNILFTKTLKKMKLDITHMLTKSTSPFCGIVPWNAAIPMGSVVLPVTFGETRENYRTEYIKFEVVDFETSYHAILGRPAIAKLDSDSVTLLGAILGAIESLTCGTHMSVVPHVSDSMAPRMAPSNVTESQSRQVHGGTSLHILGTNDAKCGRCTLTVRGLEDILRLRHRSCGTRRHESSTQHNDGDLRCIQKACPK
jgi:hypothetical protein